MKLKTLKEENPAFFIWAKKVYGEHNIGALLLAVYMYECCRENSDAITWDIMRTMDNRYYDSAAWLLAAEEVLKT